MKHKISAFFKKLILILLACLMLVFVLPLWVFQGEDIPSAEGEFIRLMPEYSAYGAGDGENGYTLVGRDKDVYMGFDLSRFQDIEEEITAVKLRLAFLKGSGTLRNDISVSIVQENSYLREGKTAELYPKAMPEYARLCPDTTGREDSLWETDLTDIARELLNQGQSRFGVILSSGNSIPVAMATDRYADSTYRPCVKVTTGFATDTDADTLDKAELIDTAVVSAKEQEKTGTELTGDNALTAGSGNEAYLKFKIDRATIGDTIYSARLALNVIGGAGNIKVYCVKNNQWTGEFIKYSTRPQGVQSADSAYRVKDTGEALIDITQQVNDNLNTHSDMLTLKIEADSEIRFQGEDIYIKASDDADIKCAETASLYAIGNNMPSFVTSNLLSSYTLGDKTAHIYWQEADAEGYIKKDGTIVRPKWFEGKREAVARARIKCGDYEVIRKYPITIAEEASPDYSKKIFGNYLNIGNSQSEEKQAFDGVNISGARRKWVSGRQFMYRVPESGGIMLLNLACVPDEQNYITFKLRSDSNWGNDIIIKPVSHEGDGVKITLPDLRERETAGFVYATYPLPKEFTQGMNQVSLRAEFSAKAQEQISSIYAVYTTQNPYFDPEQFEGQGEKIINEPYLGANTAQGILKVLKEISFGEEQSSITVVPEELQGKRLYREGEDTIVADSKDINIAYSLTEKDFASVYETMTYYDRYCASCPVIYKDGLAMVDYGGSKLIINDTDREVAVFDGQTVPAGLYKEIAGQKYYSFSEEWQSTDDSLVPDGATVLNGQELVSLPNSVMLLKEVAKPLTEADWRVTRLNGYPVAEFEYSQGDIIENVTIKAVGGIPDKAEDIKVIICVYQGGKLKGMYKDDVSLVRSAHQYTVEIKKPLELTDTSEIKIFVIDGKKDLEKLTPKLKLP